MATIICLETSANICSVAVSVDGTTEFYIEDTTERNHARVLTSFLEKALQWIEANGKKAEAIAVSMGPGSYTGLRIGLSEAKGLAYALNIPLIGLSTLEIMAESMIAQEPQAFAGKLLVPMVDARRMEVYMAAYSSDMMCVVKPSAQIIDDECLPGLRVDGRPKVYFGSGAAKSFAVIGYGPDTVIDDIWPTAKMMSAPAERKFLAGEFLDLAYSTPEYLKDFYATTPKNKVL